MTNLGRRICRRASIEADKLLKGNRYHNWYVFTKQLSDELEGQILPHYTSAGEEGASEGEEVVVVHNGWTESGGLADRLRGIVSTYLLCKELGRKFRILFTHPFPLELFLVPNAYDWRISKEAVKFSLQQAKPVCLEVGSESRWQAHKQKAFIQRGIEAAEGKQVHIYTNALFAYYEGFGKAFQELFKPSERLQATINKERKTLGEGYVSVSARFMGALGDFTDTTVGDALPEDKKHLLLKACMAQLEQIHQQHPQVRLLVNSDSTTFLAQASQYPFVYTIPGRILHLDVPDGKQDEESLYQTYEKTLLDFFMIAHADVVYRLQGQWMRASGFPYAASLVYEKPFKEVKWKMKD